MCCKLNCQNGKKIFSTKNEGHGFSIDVRSKWVYSAFTQTVV